MVLFFSIKNEREIYHLNFIYNCLFCQKIFIYNCLLFLTVTYYTSTNSVVDRACHLIEDWYAANATIPATSPQQHINKFSLYDQTTIIQDNLSTT